MSNENKVPEGKPEGDSKPIVKAPPPDGLSLGNQIANKQREAIYDKFDKQSLANDKSAPPAVKEESEPDKDSKEKSESAINPDKVEELEPEKSTSVSKGKEKSLDDGGLKTVPLQALQESRERFKRINLEYRQYKETQEKELFSLKEEVNKLSKLLKEPKQNSTNDDLSEVDEEKSQLRRQLDEHQAKLRVSEDQKKAEAAQEAQKTYHQKIEKVTKELTEEGYPGFDFAIVKTGQLLRKMLTDGEITQTEENDESMWKKVFKEQIYEEMQSVLTKQDKSDMMAAKKEAKKKANLIADPGKAPEVIEEVDDKPMTYDQFVKSQRDEIIASKRKRR